MDHNVTDQKCRTVFLGWQALENSKFYFFIIFKQCWQKCNTGNLLSQWNLRDDT